MENSYADEELLEFKEQLRQFKEAGTVKVTSILQRLLNTKITVAQMQSTKIAQTIKSLSTMSGFDDQQEGQTINELASKIIAKWKKVVEDSKAPVQTAAKSLSNSSKQQQIPQIKRQLSNQGSSNESWLDKEEPVFSEGNDKLPTYKSDTRGMAAAAFLKIFQKVSPDVKISTIEQVDFVVQLERNILSRTSQVIAYKSNVKEVLAMFSSPEVIFEVITRLLSNEISIVDVAEAKSTVFLTDNQRIIIQKQQEEKLSLNDPEFYNNIRRQRLRGLEGEICKACKKKTAFLVKELQTRSADEPMTRFMECNDCGKSWRD